MKIRTPRAERLVVVSPAPPLKTGTADYVPFFLAGIGPMLGRFRDVVVVIDSGAGTPDLGHLAARLPPGAARGLEGVRFARFDDFVPRAGDLQLVFVANNEFHQYAIRYLTRPKHGYVVAVVHEPQVLMNVAAMCRDGRHGFAPADLGRMLDGECRGNGTHLAGLIREHRLPALCLYQLLGIADQLEACDEIWVHSHFARLKLLLETPLARRPDRVKVVAHPALMAATAPDGGDPGDPGSPGRRRAGPPAARFLVGLFGWIAPGKRVTQVLEAFARFSRRLDDPAGAHLLLVGQLPPPGYYDPVARIAELGIASRVTVAGHVPPAEFERLFRSCALHVNLRFPGCGETSGTLRRAGDIGVAVATTRYQAFHEEPATYRCTSDERQEAAELDAILRRAYRSFRYGIDAPPGPRPPAAIKRPVAEAFGETLAAVGA